MRPSAIHLNSNFNAAWLFTYSTAAILYGTKNAIYVSLLLCTVCDAVDSRTKSANIYCAYSMRSVNNIRIYLAPVKTWRALSAAPVAGAVPSLRTQGNAAPKGGASSVVWHRSHSLAASVYDVVGDVETDRLVAVDSYTVATNGVETLLDEGRRHASPWAVQVCGAAGGLYGGHSGRGGYLL